MIHVFAKTHQLLDALDPGWRKTELFWHKISGAAQSLSLWMISRTGEESARTTVHAASAGESTHGRYLSECEVKSEPNPVRSGSVSPREVGKAVKAASGVFLAWLDCMIISLF